jgi:protein-S-isoprenylcysteine O-methyltransferase Ste14
MLRAAWFEAEVMANLDGRGMQPAAGVAAAAVAGAWGPAARRFQARARVADPRLLPAGSDAYDLAIRVAAGGFFASLAAAYLASALHAPRLAELARFEPPALEWLSTAAIGLFYLTVTLFIIFRETPRAKAPGLLPRLAAIAGSYILGLYALFPRNEHLPAWLHLAAALLLLGGTGASVWVLAWLGRSFSVMAEARRLVTTGPYRFVRHPLYLTEFVSTVGVFIAFASPWTTLLLLLQVGLQLQRMRNEERILGATFPAYAGYAATTRRLLPGLW